MKTEMVKDRERQGQKRSKKKHSKVRDENGKYSKREKRFVSIDNIKLKKN